MLLHLLQAVVVRVDEVKGQRPRQRTAPSSRGDPQKPVGGSQVPISEMVRVTQRDVEAVLAWPTFSTMSFVFITQLYVMDVSAGG